MRATKILPSLLAADFSRLGEEVRAVESAGADMLHLDVMDGHFVPNISFGAGLIKALRPLTTIPFDVHLMIAPADPYLADFAKAGADIITVHAEAGPHLHRSLIAIRQLGKKAGVALNPATPPSCIAQVLDVCDLVCIMTVNPGFGGQSFIADKLGKIAEVASLCAGREIAIEVDGGVTLDNASACARAGATHLVAGSSVFKGGTGAYEANIAAIRHEADEARRALG